MSIHSRGSSGSDYTLEDLEAEAPPKKAKRLSKAVDKLRNCSVCEQPARIVSNYLGTRAYCGPCKRDWAIAMMPRNPQIPFAPGRALSKETAVEQYDYDLAFEDLEKDDFFKPSGES